MNSQEIDKKIKQSIKWSGTSEIVAKSIVPITNMILARLLAPEEFGIIATVTMVTSFADIFTDAGFQKFLIQKQFKTKEELYRNANVAFWTNLSVSIFIWIIIAIFSKKITYLVGAQGLENIIIIASTSLIFTAFSSIQMAIYKKEFDFKMLFRVRLISLFIPFLITIPLALFGLSYWSLIIGNLCINLSNALILTLKSSWKPRFYYDFRLLKEMFSFSGWILVESIFLWMTTWCTTFIIGNYLNDYYLGIYKNSETMVNSILNIVVYSTSTVLLSALSSVNDNNLKYNKIFFSFQKNVSLLLIPLGFGIFLYKDLITDIMLGSQWVEASLFIGLWSLVNIFTILTGQYISIVFTSKGLPKLAVLSQIIQLIILISIIKVSINYGFTALIIGRCIARLSYGIINLCIAKIYLKISPIYMLKGLIPAITSSIVMLLFGSFIKLIHYSYLWSFFSIFCCIIVYFITLLLFPSVREMIFVIIKESIRVKKVLFISACD